MAFGKVLFGGSRFLFWALAVPLLAFAAIMLLLVDRWSAKTILIVVPLVFGSLLLLLALASPTRFKWAGRTVAAMVFVGYAAYAIEMWFFSSEPFRLFEARNAASPRNALLGLAIIGVPSLLYAALGRFTLRPEPEVIAESDEEGSA